MKESLKFVTKFQILLFFFVGGAKECQSCRSRKMLKNGYLLAKIGADTAENEPLKVHLIFKLWDSIFTEPARPDCGQSKSNVQETESAASMDTGAKEQQ